MHCALLKEENQITNEERQEAIRCNVKTLFGAKPPKGKKFINLDSMNCHPANYYGHMRDQCEDVTHIISHVPDYLYAPFNIKESLFGRKPPDLAPKIILVVHDLPKEFRGKR